MVHTKNTKRPRTDVDATAVETLHGNGETLALSTNQVLDGDFTVLHNDSPGLLRVPSKFVLFLSKAQALKVLLDNEARDALGSCSSCASHDHVHIRRSPSGDKGLASVQDVVRALLDGSGREPSGI